MDYKNIRLPAPLVVRLDTLSARIREITCAPASRPLTLQLLFEATDLWMGEMADRDPDAVHRLVQKVIDGRKKRGPKSVHQRAQEDPVLTLAQLARQRKEREGTRICRCKWITKDDFANLPGYKQVATQQILRMADRCSIHKHWQLIERLERKTGMSAEAALEMLEQDEAEK